MNAPTLHTRSFHHTEAPYDWITSHSSVNFVLKLKCTTLQENIQHNLEGADIYHDERIEVKCRNADLIGPRDKGVEVRLKLELQIKPPEWEVKPALQGLANFLFTVANEVIGMWIDVLDGA